MSNKALVLQDGKNVTVAGTANGQFLVNNGSNEVVFSSATVPTAGQVPVWSGSAWAPGTISPGGNGGGGLTYLLNYSVAGASPTPSGTWKQLSLTPTASAYNTGGGAVTAPNGGTYANLANFVTPLTEPGTTTTPPGFWDLNVYLTSNGAADETLFRFSVHKWDGTTLSAAIATSSDVGIDNPATVTLYTASVFVPSTVLSATERIAIKVEVTRTSSNTHAVTGYFEGVYYTHMHTTLGAPGSTGLVKVVNGIIQAPATLLVNADVSNTAAILVSKISGAAPLASPTFTGTVTIPAGASISGFAPLASPTFTGTPLSTTASVDTNTTQIATTAYVVGQGYAKLVSPTFSGTPSLPTGTTGVTQGAGSNTTALATTAFVTAAVTASSGAPYDVAGEYVGKPPVSTVLMRFIANRSWTLKRTLVQASCTAFPTGSNAVATISVAGSNITSGTITWATAGSTVTIGAFADTAITSGQAVVLTVTTADSGNVFENPFFTLGGVVA